MADDQISVKIVVDARQAKDGFKQVEDQAKEMADKVKTAGASAPRGLRKPLEVSQAADARGDRRGRRRRQQGAEVAGDRRRRARTRPAEKILSNSKGLPPR